MMSIRDIIEYLKSGKADRKRASKAFFTFGGVFLVPFILTAVLGIIENPSEQGFETFREFQEITQSFQLGLAILCLICGAAIRKGYSMSKQLGQVTLGLIFISILYYFSQFIPKVLSDFPFEITDVFGMIFFIIPGIFIIIFVGLAALMTFYGVRYLGRLPNDVSDKSSITQNIPEGRTHRSLTESTPEDSYVEAIFKIGLFATFVAFIMGFMLVMAFLIKLFKAQAGFIFPIIFLILFLSPVLFNKRASRFEKNRQTIKSITGGGSIGLFNGTTPFFRLMIYGDAVEVRVMFHAYLIPYDRMPGPPARKGALFKGLLFKSDLPGVPPSIRFYGVSDDDIKLISNKYNQANGIAVPSSDAVDQYRLEKNLTKQATIFAVKAFIMVLLIHILSLWLLGTIFGQIAISKEIDSSAVVQTFLFGEYTSLSPHAPTKFKYVLVIYDSERNVKKEVFLSTLGDVTTVEYKNGMPYRQSGTYYSSKISSAFPMVGILLILLSQLFGADLIRKQKRDDRTRLGVLNKIQIIGFCMFISIFIVGPIKDWFF